jgi:uncharacterized membrane protein
MGRRGTATAGCTWNIVFVGYALERRQQKAKKELKVKGQHTISKTVFESE